MKNAGTKEGKYWFETQEAWDGFLVLVLIWVMEVFVSMPENRERIKRERLIM